MRVLVTGAGGMLGRAVAGAARARGHDVVALARADADVTDAAALRAALARAAPQAVVNCAAWTDVDGAEADEAGATRVNGTGAGNVASAAAGCGARVVHVSTDYVFDGFKREPYLEDDPVGPRSAYGRSKLAGERAVAEAAGDHAIVRTAWLFGAGGRNFVDTMLGLGAERDEVRVVTDQIGCPTWTGHLAPALLDLAAGTATGVFHVAAAGACSWHELAVEAFRRAGLACDVRPTTTADFPRPAPRPAFSVLRSARPETPALPAWQEGLAAYLDQRVPVGVTE
ncbi:MAG TPA: dTDP-4-dehydrorhamnose reductase [Solirubrobacteraceae bacterium]|nr:dTDP-4-dehydrorhamnose reductase [Solirubrobacteraceae bacterium]